jgi:adenylate cyclase
VQAAKRERNANIPEDRRIVYRIGINIGDIVVEDEDIYGDGVNVPARLDSASVVSHEMPITAFPRIKY